MTRQVHLATRWGYSRRDHGAIEPGARFGEAGTTDPCPHPGVPLHKTLAALFLVLTAAVGTFAVPAHRACRPDVRCQGRDHRRGDARRDVGLPLQGRSGLRRGEEVHAQRRTRSTARTRPGRRSRARRSARRWSSTSATAMAGPARTPKDPAYTTKDGFGLNATAGNGDSNTKYYGEPYVSTLDLAPNAVILLHHLCYASGNSEPGNPAPTSSVAKQRVDNYGAGFLKGRRQCRHRRRPPRSGRLPARPVHHRPAPGRPVAHPAQLPRQRVLVRVDPNVGQDRAHGSGHVDLGLLPLLRRQPERDDDPGARVALPRARRRPPAVCRHERLQRPREVQVRRDRSSGSTTRRSRTAAPTPATARCPPVTRGQMASFIARAMELPVGHEGLLQRRQRQDPRSRHQQDRRGRADRRLRARAVLPERLRQSRPDGRPSWSARWTCPPRPRTTSTTTTAARSSPRSTPPPRPA